MRAILTLVLVVYLVGVGVELAPTVQGKWSTATASELASSVADALPDALAWPAKAFRAGTNHG
jgi:hypothetical protein